MASSRERLSNRQKIISDIIDINLSGNNTIAFSQDNTWAPSNLNAEFNTFNSVGFCDTDEDGVENRLDLDSDNDGCSDALESKTTISAVANFQYANKLKLNPREYAKKINISLYALVAEVQN